MDKELLSALNALAESQAEIERLEAELAALTLENKMLRGELDDKP